MTTSKKKPKRTKGRVRATALEVLARFGEMNAGGMMRRNQDLARGSLYTTLIRLEQEGLVTSRLVEQPVDQSGPARRFYTLTERGYCEARLTAELWKLRDAD